MQWSREPNDTSRRQFLSATGLGLGAFTFSCWLQEALMASPTAPVPSHDWTPKRGHFPARAKSVIMLFQNGGASQMDLFDPKPELQTRHGQTAPNVKGGNANAASSEPLMASPFKFTRHGKVGVEFSELVPHLGSVVDDLCVVRSMYSVDPNHPGATYMMCSCNPRPGRPTLGAWSVYGLGTENQNLPGYVCLRDPGAFHSGGAMQITNGWMPPIYRGTELRSEGDPILNLNAAVPKPSGAQRNNLELLEKLNERQRRRFPDESALTARIQNYELAARMQLTAAKELDISGETEDTRKLYGMDQKITEPYGRRLLLARRLVERGVRFVQVLAPPPHGSWDHHGDLPKRLTRLCAQTDLPSAGLIMDLKRRGLLDETLVIWTGEFGRLPTSQNTNGRDHNPHGFTLLLAGGGLKAGYVHGATDEIGYAAVEGRVGVPDLMATILHLLGLDHNRLTFNLQGIEQTLTDSKINNARVVGELLA
jgi:hypothetical protein